MSVLNVIGNTPLLQVWKKGDVTIYAKIEGFNPTGSIKDRIARFMVEDAERKGLLKRGMTIVEASSGNTGISLAMVGAVKGYCVKIVMPESMSVERRRMILSYGARLVLTPAREYTDGSIEVAKALSDEEGTFFINQFGNSSNVQAHYETTGAEIADEIAPTHLVAGIGTGGTIMGVGRRLLEANPELEIIGVEPRAGEEVQGLKNTGVYKKPGILDSALLDRITHVGLEESVEKARAIAEKFGVSVGHSSGAAMRVALQVAKGLKRGTIITIFPDRGDRYLSMS